MHLRYSGVRVTDLDRSLRFYTKALGLREVGRGDLSPFGRGTWVLLQDPASRQRLELNWYPKDSQFDVPFVVGEGLDHIGFFLGPVPATTLHRTYQRLLRQGATPTNVTPATTAGWVGYVTDPDGNWIEIFRDQTPEERRRAKARKPRKRRP
ncbi:MAG TPA: VOC family protein [Thermoplasmata archaeon]|nr:VOC family protein [Thermoplasmata archaeon]